MQSDVPPKIWDLIFHTKQIQQKNQTLQSIWRNDEASQILTSRYKTCRQEKPKQKQPRIPKILDLFLGIWMDFTEGSAQLA